MKSWKYILISVMSVLVLTAQIPSPPVALTAGVNNGVPISITNPYCDQNGNWVGPRTDSFANLPNGCYFTDSSGTPSPGVVRGPDSTIAAINADLNAANCGDTIVAQAGGSDVGTINFPNKPCDAKHYIHLITTGVSDPNFPLEGQRITPCAAGLSSYPGRPSYPCNNTKNLLFKVMAPNASNAMRMNGNNFYRITGFEITRVPTGGVAIYNLVDMQGTATAETNHIIFDRNWFHGILATFPSTSTATDTSTTRAIYLGQSNHVGIIDNYFSDFYDTSAMSANGNTDAQCIGGGAGGVANTGWGYYEIIDNHCEASGEGILLGGSSGPPRTPTGCTVMVNCNLDVPSDSVVLHNYFFKPLAWNGNTTTPGGTGWPVVKNGFEMKTGARWLFEGNVIENVWYNAQVGYCWSTAPKNQSGGSPLNGSDLTALTNDFTYRYNYCYNAAYGIALYQSMDSGCSTCQGQGANGISEHDNLIGDNLNLGSLSGQSAGDEMEMYAAKDSSGAGLNKIQNVNISHNTFVHGIRGLAIFGADSTGLLSNWTMQNNIWYYANFGWMDIGNTGGCDTPFDNGNNAFAILNACVTGWTVDHNAVFGWNGGVLGAKWPTDGKGANNFFFTGTTSIGFVAYGTGDSKFNPFNYQLSNTSPLKGAASDGKDVGADINAIVQAISGVRL